MAVTAATIRASLDMKSEVERYVVASELPMLQMWSTAWNEIADEYALAVGELADLADKGDWPTRTQVLRAQRVENALKVTQDQMRGLIPGSQAAATAQLGQVLGSAEHWSERIARTQLPHGLSLGWSRVSADAMQAIVERSTQRIHALHLPLTAEMERNMKAVLIRGVPVGENPRAAARQIMGRCQQVFSGGRSRALNIARTELLDAHRAAALQARKANADVLGGWRWLATLNDRTCPSCMAMNGRKFPNDKPGPLDHQQGRCTSVPITKPWSELGFKGIPEPADDFPDAELWFLQQPDATKLKIMGPERLRRLEAGELEWADMAMRVSTPGWRDSFHVAPLNVVPDATDLVDHPPITPTPAELLPDPELEHYTDAELRALVQDAELAGDDPSAYEFIQQSSRELDRRTRLGGVVADADRDAEAWRLGPIRGKPTSQKQLLAQAQTDFDDYVYRSRLDAEAATNGNLIRRAVMAEFRQKYGSVEVLFEGSINRAFYYASEELLRFWEANPRLTMAEFAVKAGVNDSRLATSAGKAAKARQDAALRAEQNYDPERKKERARVKARIKRQRR